MVQVVHPVQSVRNFIHLFHIFYS